ncbi:hypothetical protein Agub_g8077, partial [Astrephomene gubernaculifera]
MQPKQLAGCPPPTVATATRQAKLRPLWRSMQASIRTPGGEPDEAQAPDRSTSEPRNPAQNDDSQQQVATVVAGPVLEHLLVPTVIGPYASADGPPYSLDAAAAAGSALGLFGGRCILTRSSDDAAAAARVSGSAGRRSPEPAHLGQARDLAISAMVLSELVGMLSGHGRKISPDEMRHVMASLDASLQGIPGTGVAGTMPPECLRDLGLHLPWHTSAPQQPSGPQFQPSSHPLSSQLAAAAASAPSVKAHQPSSASYASAEPCLDSAAPSSCAQWSTPPDHPPAVHLPGLVASSAALMCAGSSDAASQTREIFSTVLCSLFDELSQACVGAGGGSGTTSGGNGGGVPRSGGGSGKSDAGGAGGSAGDDDLDTSTGGGDRSS